MAPEACLAVWELLVAVREFMMRVFEHCGNFINVKKYNHFNTSYNTDPVVVVNF